MAKTGAANVVNKLITLYQKTEFTKRLFIKARTLRASRSSRTVEYIWVTKHLGKSRRILDVGSTGSVYPIQLASIGYEVYSIDLRNYLEWHRIAHPNMTFVKGDICQCPFISDFFDAITAISTIEHIGTEDYLEKAFIDENRDLKAIQEIARILRSNGLFIFTVPYMRGKRDEQTIRNRLLRESFTIEKEEYFYIEGNFWYIASKEHIGMKELGKNEGLACIAARKI